MTLNGMVKAAEEGRMPCLFLSPRAIKGRSGMELSFAFYLARRAFEEKSNISPKLPNEALLFLAKEMNFATALRKIGAKSARDFVLVCEKGVPIARTKKLLQLSSAKKIALSKMGRKKGAYTEGELAVEEMALARVRN
jgi:tRNA threonylcarbamoyladenosine modification (KEOPS) complex Cgi121 subunit